jgi:hypothetical protein
MSDMREELERLRRDVDQLMARLPVVDASVEPSESGQVNDALVRKLEADLAAGGKTRGIAIGRIVVIKDGRGTSVASGIITSVRAEDFQKPTKLRASVAALATDPLAIRAVRKLIEPFFDGQPMRMTKAALAAAFGASDEELENSLRPLVADKMLLWSRSATGEETYEIHGTEPHILLIQSLE